MPLTPGQMGSPIATGAMTLVNFQILDLPNAPIELLPGQGDDMVIHVISGRLLADTRDGAYGGFGNQSGIYIGLPGVWRSTVIPAEPLLGVSGVFTVPLSPLSYSGGSGGYAGESVINPFPATENQSVYIFAENGANPFTGGSQRNTLVVTLFYSITRQEVIRRPDPY